MSSSIELEVRRHSPRSPWTYALLDRRQRELGREIRQTGRAGALLLSELAPVITIGRRTPKEDLLLNEAELARLGVERIETDRGGLATYHGPGQWVLFAVDRLERLTGDRRGVRLAVRALLRIAMETAARFGIEAGIRQGVELGVWSPRGKLAAVGIRVEQGILLHGLSLNVRRTPQSFVGLRPCGLDAAVDFLERDFEEVRQVLAEIALRELWNQR